MAHYGDGDGNIAGQFSEGDPANGIAATEVTAAWLNDIQNNQNQAILDAGIALIKGNAGQLSAAIQALAQGAVGIPAGSIVMTGRSTAPSGWLMCDGSQVSRTTYATLFAAIGVNYGAGNGTTTFNLPDNLGRAPIGAGAGSGLTARTLGAKVGLETHTLTVPEMPSHTHTQDPHTHGITTPATMNLNGTENRGPGTDPTIQSSATVATNQNTGGGGAHNNMQPSIAHNFIIRT